MNKAHGGQRKQPELRAQVVVRDNVRREGIDRRDRIPAATGAEEAVMLAAAARTQWSAQKKGPEEGTQKRDGGDRLGPGEFRDKRMIRGSRGQGVVGEREDKPVLCPTKRWPCQGVFGPGGHRW